VDDAKAWLVAEVCGNIGGTTSELAKRGVDRVQVYPMRLDRPGDVRESKALIGSNAL
jgi:hypothetical protein